MKLLRPIACALAVALSAAPAIAQNASADSDFLVKAQQQMLGLYALSALGRDHATNASLKSLSANLAQDTGKANDTIKTLAKSHNVTLQNKPTVRADTQYGDIQSMKGGAFDTAFKQDLTVDLSFAESTFSDYAQNGSDSQLKSFAKDELVAIKKAEASVGH